MGGFIMLFVKMINNCWYIYLMLFDLIYLKQEIIFIFDILENKDELFFKYSYLLLIGILF